MMNSNEKIKSILPEKPISIIRLSVKLEKKKSVFYEKSLVKTLKQQFD